MSRAELEQELSARGVTEFIGEKDELQVRSSICTVPCLGAHGRKLRQLPTIKLLVVS